ncbi:MAG: hypothetical protein C5B48_05615 [Candidatus Rokuibacteriota bacterium]|nr:MAG: hypothetical protein C5B48_05615 [Candidatus Rokubacteria bacterium]
MEQTRRDRSLVELLAHALLGALKRTTKLLAEPLLAAARRSGRFRLARGATSAGQALDRGRRVGNLTGVRLALSEPARYLAMLETSDPAPKTAPITTEVTILDGSKEALVFSSNHVLDQWGRIVLEVALDEEGRPFTFRSLRAAHRPLDEPRPVVGSVAYLSNTGVHNFGHWLLFLYPLVQYYREYLGDDPDYYYVGKPIESWHYDSLAVLGIEPSRVLTDAVVGDRMLAAIADRAIPCPTSFLDFSTDALRRPAVEAERRRRIYISRALRPTRRALLNESECLEVLERYGFDEYRTETLSLDEEAELFAGAEMVVALSGAGLANLLLSHAGCVVVELFPRGYSTAWFVEVSAARELTYARLYGEPTRTFGLYPNEYHAVIDPRKLDAVLAEAASRLAETRRPSGAAGGVRSERDAG